MENSENYLFKKKKKLKGYIFKVAFPVIKTIEETGH